MAERRRFTRHPIKVAVSITTADRHDRAGVTRDLSASGLLFHSLSRFAIGEEVVVMFSPQSIGRRARVKSATGRVVRAVEDPKDTSFLRFVTAVRFDAPLLDLALPRGSSPTQA